AWAAVRARPPKALRWTHVSPRSSSNDMGGTAGPGAAARLHRTASRLSCHGDVARRRVSRSPLLRIRRDSVRPEDARFLSVASGPGLRHGETVWAPQGTAVPHPVQAALSRDRRAEQSASKTDNIAARD